MKGTLMDLDPEHYQPYRMAGGGRTFSFRWMGEPGLMLYVLGFIAFVIIEQVIAHSIGTGSTVHAAEALGYSDIKVTARHTIFPNFQGCGKSDQVKFDVTATDPKGATRTFFVCDGVFKGATVRFD